MQLTWALLVLLTPPARVSAAAVNRCLAPLATPGMVSNTAWAEDTLELVLVEAPTRDIRCQVARRGCARVWVGVGAWACVWPRVRACVRACLRTRLGLLIFNMAQNKKNR